MPGVLIEDMPFSLDYPVSTSPFLDNLSPPSRHQQPHHHHHPRHHHPQHLLDTIMASVSSSSSTSSAPTSPMDSPRGTPHDTALTALHRFLPSNTSDDSPEDVYSCDEFRMFEFKVRRCMRGRSHDWTECPFAHPGEKARRRDPRRFHYSGTACPDFRKGSCKNGDACELAHGVFECWLHPARYRTQPCKDGRSCKRRVCFFAHTSEQLRLLPQVSQAIGSSSSSSSGVAGTSSTCSSSSPPPSPGSLFSCLASGSPSSASSPSPGSFLSDAFSPRRSSTNAATASLLRSFSEKSVISPSPNPSLEAFEIGNTSAGSIYCQCCHQPQQQQQQQQQHARAVAACSAARHVSSPTSTLVGLAASPPPLSPPLSPSQSPPMSPSSGGIASAVPRRHLDSRRLSFASAPSSPGSHHPLHAKTMSDLVTALQQLELQKSVSATGSLPHGTVGGTAGWVQCSPQYSTGPSPLRPGGVSTASWAAPCGIQRGASVSMPCTPTKPRWDTMWEMEMGEEDLLEEQEMLSMPVPRVESGRDLRAKIYGRLANKAIGSGGSGGESSGLGIGYEAGGGEPSPDLNWVNDLVTE